MQKSILKLKEIIWEVTGACKNHCSYCGSKDCWDEAICEDNIIKIAEAIAKYPPEAIDISGGDPLLVSFNTHKKLIDILTSENDDIKVKILCNPKSLDRMHKQDMYSFVPLLDLYDWVGVSINTKEELEIFTKLCDKFYINGITYTIISNFNIKNLYIFDKIKQFVKERNLLWQIQYTVYELPDHDMALYNDDDALAKFYDLIQKAMDEGVKIVMADNMNSGSCGAGYSSLGILSDGTVVPCLSMRSWNENVYNLSQGNILNTSLTEIWYTKFNEYRFKEFKCCKDHCKNKAFCPANATTWKWVEIPEDKYKPQPPSPQVVMYGVQDSPIYVYGVATPITPIAPRTSPRVVSMYAVQIDPMIDWKDNMGTTTSFNTDCKKKDKT